MLPDMSTKKIRLAGGSSFFAKSCACMPILMSLASGCHGESTVWVWTAKGYPPVGNG